MRQLQHVRTRKNLHSHAHRSPLSAHQEVSAYDGAGDAGDSGDDWLVELADGAGSWWLRSAPVRLLHRDTQQYLETAARSRFG